MHGNQTARVTPPPEPPPVETMPRLRDHLIVNELAEETLVYDPRSQTAHRLPALFALIVHHADGTTPVARVIAILAPRVGGARAARQLLRSALAELVAKGLLATPAAAGPSRRSFLARSGQLAIALPAITSLVAPGPAAAVSIVGTVPPVLSAAPGALDNEGYDSIEDNPFRAVRLHPVSTFAADVDTASYSNVRRFLTSGQLPPPGAVRIEELLNYFPYDDPEPGDESPLALHAELSECPWHPAHRLLRLGLQARRIPLEALPPRNLVFLLDVSGSMQSADKLPLLRSAMRLLVETLRAEDQVAIAVYAGAAGLVLEPTPGSQPAAILAALDALDAGGSTNGGAGIELAYRLAGDMARAGSANRVILATDGDFNVGVSDRSSLVRLIERQRASGVFLSVLGFGTGNLKDAAMEQLADHGNGNYAYIDSLAEARKVLVEEAGATLDTVAKDVKLQVEWNPHEVEAYRLIGYQNRRLSREDFDDDSRDAGEIGSGHHLTALYELIEPGTATPARPAAPLRYQQAERPSAHATSGELGFLRLRYQGLDGGPSALRSWPLERFAVAYPAAATSDDFRLAAGVALFGMLLRDTPHRGEGGWQLVHDLVASTLAGDAAGYRRELLALVAEAGRLSAQPVSV